MKLCRLMIIATKVIPVIMALSYMADDILMFYGINSVFINYLSGISLLTLLYFYLTSYALKFCKYHRVPLHYIVVCNAISFYDFYIGIPISNESLHASIVLFNRHKTLPDYLNSIVHEAEHVKQAVLKAYRVDDFGEESAYTVGHIVEKMYGVFKGISV